MHKGVNVSNDIADTKKKGTEVILQFAQKNPKDNDIVLGLWMESVPSPSAALLIVFYGDLSFPLPRGWYEVRSAYRTGNGGKILRLVHVPDLKLWPTTHEEARQAHVVPVFNYLFPK